MSEAVATKTKLIEKIRRAFADVVLDGGTGAEEAYACDASYDTMQAQGAATSAAKTRDLTETSWELCLSRQYTFGDLFIGHTELFSFVDDKGFRFYLPACITALLQHWEQAEHEVAVYLIYSLTPSLLTAELDPSDDPAEREEDLKYDQLIAQRKRDKYAILTPEQASCVTEFLDFCVENGDKGQKAAAERALVQYWSRF